jgi:amino acid adenylation domain-containing protein
MLCDAAPTVLLTQQNLEPILPATRAEVLILEAIGPAEGADANLPVAELGLTSAHLVYVIYTSGSTGRPKGTAMAHRSMVNLLHWHGRQLPLRSAGRVLQFAALSFDVAFQEIFSTLCAGGTLVLLSEEVRRNPRALLDFLRLQQIERLFLPPLMLQSLGECAAAAGAGLPADLREVITAGEQLRISPEIVTFLARLNGCRLHNHYGPTETHVVTALTLPVDPRAWPALPSIGQPIANVRIHVLDRRRQPVPIGVTGEIYIGGVAVARGYLHRPELTAERFVDDPFSVDPQARLYRTGDLARWRAAGTLEYLGRNDDQVKIRGFRIELGEVTAELVKHERVRDAAVVAREDEPGAKRLVAYFTQAGAAAPSVKELRAHLQATLPDYMIPGAFVLLGQLPLSPNGKLHRSALPAPDLAAYVEDEYEAPQGEVEEAIADIWRDLLRIGRVGRHDNFFHLGGHSLLAARVIAHVSDRLELDLPLRMMFERPTVAGLADCILREIAAEMSLESP